jgi:heparanase
MTRKHPHNLPNDKQTPFQGRAHRLAGPCYDLHQGAPMLFARRFGSLLGVILIMGVAPASGAESGTTAINPETLSRIATVDVRFQSYNVEMAEVIGGKFWKPYSQKPPVIPSTQSTKFTIGQDPTLFEARPPVDLTNKRLRKLAGTLGPAYVRVSGTWANSAYFQNDNDAPKSPAPKDFQGVLTRTQWAGVIDFSRAVGAKLVTSFAISPGVRDAAGIWTPDQARQLVDYTKSIGGEIAAAELFNEPTMPVAGGAPPGYNASTFAQDEAVFREFVKDSVPEMLVAGPGSVGEGGMRVIPPSTLSLTSQDLLETKPRPKFDVFSYHFYGAVSQRCEAMGPDMGTTPAKALSEEWLARTDRVFDFYKPLHAQYTPGAPIWVTETADAACGGNPWAATFLDSFRYVDQMGRLAKRGVQAIFHNTLDASEYGLLDQSDFEPRPNYWAALLWRRLMRPVVLDAGTPREGLHLYAHCLRGQVGGVALVAINNSETNVTALSLAKESTRYTLTAMPLQSGIVRLNGRELRLQADDNLPSLEGTQDPAGRIELAPASITFLAVPNAANPVCTNGDVQKN